ncbi:MAG: S1 RNA-binding domain-containing protein, partial [Chloroflexota bacterium]
MTEEQQGGTAPDTEAPTSVTPQAPEETVTATAVVDEPAPMADVTPEDDVVTPEDDVATDDVAAATAEAPVVDAVSPTPEREDASADVPAESSVDATADATAVAEAPTAEPESAPPESELPADDTADAPAASDEPEPELPPRDLGPEPTTMEELLAEQDSDIKSFKHGDVVEGNVVRIDKDEILVDIGAKSEGVVSNRELFGRQGEGQAPLAIGDTVLVYVLQPESPEGHAVLSLRRAGLERKWRAMQEQFEAGVIIEAPVIDHNKGGLIVDCGIRGFVPISQIVDFPRRPQNDQPRDAAQEIAEKLMPFVGRKLRLKILEVNRKANRLILSEKVALYEERREKRDELF